MATIPIRTLDEIVAMHHGDWEHLPIRLVKIDVEGMQLDVLEGAQDLLDKHRPHLVIEIATPEEQHAVEAFLRQWNYSIVDSFCATPTFHFIDPSRHTLRKPSLQYRIRRLRQKLQRRHV